MGRVDYTEPQPGDARDATPINTVFTDIQTESASLDADNVPFEAFDRSSLDPAEMASDYDNSAANTNIVLSKTNTAFELLDYSTVAGTDMAIDLKATAGTDEAIRVRASVEIHYDYTGGNPGVPAGNTVEVALFRKTGAGAALEIDNTRVRMGAVGRGTSATLTTHAWILGFSSVDRVELRARIRSAGTYRCRNASMDVRLYKDCN